RLVPTTIVARPPGPRVNKAPKTTQNGAVVETAPLILLPPRFGTMSERYGVPPTATDPKSWEGGVNDRVTGGGGGTGEVAPEMTPEMTFAVATLMAPISAPTSLPSVPAFLYGLEAASR